jgi:predicted polyphosphate/ATP-dependent NAD kinase
VSDLKIGFLINPLAGVGGPVGLKGSDGLYEQSLALGGSSKVAERAMQCLELLVHRDIQWLTAPGVMGADVLSRLSIDHDVVGDPLPTPTSGQDTRRCVSELADAGIELLLFGGGDGTARDVVDSVGKIPAIVGIPCGVKMHSGVFGTTPRAVSELIIKMIEGEVLSVVESEVRDIDEESFRQGVVKTTFYGELPVPEDLRFVQQTKIGGKEVEDLVVQDIAADFIENMDPAITYIMGSGSTIAMIMAAMDLPATLLGIDVIENGELLASDVTERQLMELFTGDRLAKIVVTAISGQGHVFGRGNQQLSPQLIRAVGIDNIEIVATKSKLAGLDHRPLLVDTGDEQLDLELSGMKTVLTGYDDRVFYRVG